MAQGTAAQTSQSPPVPPQAPPSKGKVLFERHEPAVTDTPAVPDDSSAPSDDTTRFDGLAGRHGVSSSSRRSRTTLRRRNPAGADADGQPSISVPEQPAGNSAVSSSQADSTPDALPEQIVLTAADAEGARQVAAQERLSVAVAAEDIDFHLNTHTGKAEVRAQLRVRNTGAEPLRQVALRISGALRWESVRTAGSAAALALQQHGIADDLDHTGVAREIAITLPQPLMPDAAVSLDLYYGGTLAASTERLSALGAPTGRAALTDWDTVTDTFTGLRGVGSVLWYPVAGASASLRDGTAVIDAVEHSRATGADSHFGLRLTLEYAGSRPETAFFCGEQQPLVPIRKDAAVDTDTGFVTAQWTRERLGPHTPSLFVTKGTPLELADGLLRVTGAPEKAVSAGEAAARIRTMLSEWLGAAPQRSLNILDLPVPGATGFADGSLLVTPLNTDAPAVLAPALVQPLASSWLPAGIAAPWLRDGLPAFLQAVWVERTTGRSAALSALAGSFHTLRAQAAAPESGFSSSQGSDPLPERGVPLASCGDPLCARAKAAYVFEMLLGMLGDAALQQAISGWAVQQAQLPGRSAAEESTAMKDLLQRVAGKRDLRWFFANWVDADRGLPDLTIVTVAPRRVERSAPGNYLPQARRPVAGPIGAEPVAPTDPRDMSERDAEALAVANGGAAGPAPGSWLVAVEVQNNGSADAEVPVTVRSGSLTNTLPLRVAAHSRATVRVPFEANPEEVLVNDGSVPESRAAVHRRSIGSLPAAPLK